MSGINWSNSSSGGSSGIHGNSNTSSSNSTFFYDVYASTAEAKLQNVSGATRGASAGVTSYDVTAGGGATIYASGGTTNSSLLNGLTVYSNEISVVHNSVYDYVVCNAYLNTSTGINSAIPTLDKYNFRYEYLF
ncbi:hypothetical protein FACS1894132_02930 [Clostridia bacterium]|nr:hypothetical protein FACS1894132_02930 [Clostridia bacterium]